jgi:hypothetical protein
MTLQSLLPAMTAANVEGGVVDSLETRTFTEPHGITCAEFFPCLNNYFNQNIQKVRPVLELMIIKSKEMFKHGK